MTASSNISRRATVFIAALVLLTAQIAATVTSVDQVSSVDALSAVDRAPVAVVPSDDRAIAHALNRLAFGARPGDIARIKQIGLATWIDQQLRPERIANGQLDTRLAALTTLSLDARTVAHSFYIPARQERRRRQLQASRDQAGTPGDQPEDSMSRTLAAPQRAPAMNDVVRRGRQVLAEMAEAKVLRAVYSERQLEEVLVDFWFNHFNVFARKGQTEIYIGQYEREAIRPYVLGSFRELLGATAKSPAMLVYLDNWMSADPTVRGGATARPSRGLNENYARELLELHTLGVDGGYAQQDVGEVARAFTGWTIGRPNDPGYRFATAMHDRGAKNVLGHRIAPGGGREDGEKVLDILASHPATTRHIAFKLAQRLVSDTPPPGVVDSAAETFRTTSGNLREVVRAIVFSPEFFAAAAYRAKVKTPFEFVVSALRATDADVRSARPIIRTLADLGMPLYLCQPPTGYDETAESWVSAGALVSRINFAVAVGAGAIPGVRVPRDSAPSALTLGSAEFQRQ
jgi:uncharacterized protein (DUF1800 family)